MSSDTLTTTIDLLRHGACHGGQIFRGHTDSLLSAEGFEQMSNTIGASPPAWDCIVSSPLRRCADFAEMLSIQYATDFSVQDNFKEISFGDWDGRASADIEQKQAPALEKFWQDPSAYTPPNGEALLDFHQRVIHEWQQLLLHRQGKNILLVCHGGVIRVLLAELLGMPLQNLLRLDIPYASLSRIQVFHSAGKPDWPQVQFVNNVYP